MEARVETKPRKRLLLPPDFVRAMLAGHSALGLAFAALIYVVCLSGTLAVFAYEFQRWEQPDGPTVRGSVSPETVAAALAAGYAQALADNSAHDMFILAPALTGSRLIVSYHDHQTGVEGSWLADAEGRLVMRAKAPWTEFLTHLHINLHLPRTWGMFIVGLTGVALLSSLVSGLLSHPRIFKDAFALRWGGSKRLQEADLHNRLGVWGLPFHIAVSLTGALLGLATLIVGVLALAAYEGDSEKAFATLLGPRAGPDQTPAARPRHRRHDPAGAARSPGRNLCQRAARACRQGRSGRSPRHAHAGASRLRQHLLFRRHGQVARRRRTGDRRHRPADPRRHLAAALRLVRRADRQDRSTACSGWGSPSSRTAA